MLIAIVLDRPLAEAKELVDDQNCFSNHHTASKLAVAVGTTVLVHLQFVFMVWEIVLVISAWRYLCIEVLLMMCWLPWLYGEAAVWLSAPGLLRNWQIW